MKIGHIAGIRDVVGFHGDSVTELKAEFEEAVEDYVATCEKLQHAPQRPYPGKVMLRIDPAVHARALGLVVVPAKSEDID